MLAFLSLMSRTILIVEDEVELRNLLHELFTADGFHVHIAGDGVSALEIIEKNKVDLILADVQMPRMSGLEMLKKIRASIGAHLPVYMMSGGSSFTPDHFTFYGATGYFEKPLNFDFILSSLKK